MKHTNKKGFTIVELVIVIAVIAILAAVLIPNLSRLVTKADKSAAMQEAKAAMDNDLINAEGDLANMEKYVAGEKQYYLVKDLGTTYAAATTDSGNVILAKTSAGLSVVTETTTGATAYYEVHEYEGKYTVSNKTYSIEKGGFTCTFANGEWTVADKT